MPRTLDVILVIDVESTCWKEAPPQGQVSDIIEVGLCTVDVGSLTRIEKRSLLVEPARSEVSTFCTELTTITAEMLTSAGTLSEAAGILKRDYQSKDRLWASWGDYDRRQFERVCRDLNVGYPFGPGHLNVKSLFAAAHGLAQEPGLSAACQHVGQPMEGTYHRGDDDAWNIAGLLCGLLKSVRNSSPA